MVVVHRLGEVTKDTVLQGAFADGLIRVCGNEDGRNCVARIDEMSVELNAGHSRHLDVADQACGLRKERRCEEIGCRRERFDGVAQRRHELPHGFAKRLIILDDRYQRTFRHRRFNLPGTCHTGGLPTRLSADFQRVSLMSANDRDKAMSPLSDGLPPSAIRLARGAVRIERCE